MQRRKKLHLIGRGYHNMSEFVTYDNQWATVAPNATIYPLTRKYYRLFMSKLHIRYMYVGNGVRAYRKDPNEFCSRILMFFSRYSIGGLSLPKKNIITEADVEKLHNLVKCYKESISQLSPGTYRQILTSSSITLYINNITTLFEWLKNNPKIAHYVTDIYRPASKEAFDLLSNGKILEKHFTGYRFCIILKDGYINVNTKRALYDYLYSLVLANEVYVSPGFFEKNSLGFSYLSGGKVYCNSKEIEMLLNIVAPGIVNKIEELVG